MSESRPFRTLLLVAAIAAGAATLVTASWEFSGDRIAANRRARLLEDLASVLPADLAGSDLVPVLLEATDPELLGSDGPVDLFVAVRGAEPVAAVFASIAPDGYNGPIHLLVGISAATSEISGVRVVSHRETPGLGDLIDLRKSRWILQFDGKSLEDPVPARWAVEKDGGQFDSITGATVTPRAIVEAIRNTLLYFERHRAQIFDEARIRARSGDSGPMPATSRNTSEQ